MKGEPTPEQLATRRELLGVLRAFLRNEYDYDALYKKFYFHYVDDLPDDSLSDEDLDIFGEIHERMDMVSDNPDEPSRRAGWISSEEFRNWLARLLANHSLRE